MLFILELKCNIDGCPNLFSRTGPLGQLAVCGGVGEVERDCVNLEDLFKYGDSNYDHSAQWMKALPKRYKYWDKVCETYFKGEEGKCIDR